MQDNFFGPAVDAISPAHPLHLIVGFQCFGHAFLAHHGSLDDFQPVFAGGVGFRQMGKEFFCKQQGILPLANEKAQLSPDFFDRLKDTLRRVFLFGFRRPEAGSPFPSPPVCLCLELNRKGC